MRVVFFLVSDNLTRIIVKEVIDINSKKKQQHLITLFQFGYRCVVSVDLLQFYISVLLVLFFLSLSLPRHSISISRVRKITSTRRTHTQTINKNCTIEWLISLNLKQCNNYKSQQQRTNKQTNKKIIEFANAKPMSESIEIINTKRLPSV